MAAGHLAPDDTDAAGLLMAGAGSLLLGLVDIGTTLAKVEVSFTAGVDAVHLQQGCVLVLVPQASLVASENSLHVQPKWQTMVSDEHLPSIIGR